MVACGLVAHTLPSQCFSIDALSFKVILMGKAQQDTKDYIGFLQECPLLQGKLSPEAMQELSGSLEEVVRKANSNIICEGDEGNSFFIIRDGEVKCTKSGVAEEVRAHTAHIVPAPSPLRICARLPHRGACYVHVCV